MVSCRADTCPSGPSISSATIRKRLHSKWAVDDAKLLAICRLRHEELLEAAHILPDGHPRVEPVAPNGLARCKLHHAAFDGHLISINRDLVVHVASAILHEPDGPVLRHGLQDFHGARIRVPRSAVLRPNREFLAERKEWFKKAV